MKVSQFKAAIAYIEMHRMSNQQSSCGNEGENREARANDLSLKWKRFVSQSQLTKTVSSRSIYVAYEGATQYLWRCDTAKSSPKD